MEDILKKMKKGKKSMHPIEHKAKMDAIGDLHKMASDMLGERLHGIKKVAVMAPDKQGLEEGLHKAQELVEQSPEHMGHDVSPEDAMASDEGEMEHGEGHIESPEEEMQEEEANIEHGMSEEELDEKIKALMELKNRMAKK